jgi:hypothetical protein
VPGRPDAPVTDPAGTARALYVRAADPEDPLPGGEFPAALARELVTEGSSGLDALCAEVRDWAAAETSRYLALAHEHPGAADVLVRRAALGSAPLALVSGAWLQWLSAPANADDPLVLRVLAVYAGDVGVGHPAASRGAAGLALLRHLRLSENAVPPARLAGDQRLGDGPFRLPAVLLAMSRRPGEFQAEILGADLCLRAAGLVPALALVKALKPGAADWDALDPSSTRLDGPAPEAGIRAAAEGLDPDRVASGFRWARRELGEWSGALYGELAAATDPAFEMAELLRLRAREGSVYHHTFDLAGRSLAEWLREAQTDASGLLAVLAESRLVKPGRSQASALVNGLVSERGPMFRVFAPEDLAIVRRWIDALPAHTIPHRPPVTRALAITVPPASDGETPKNRRDAYHQLLTREGTPALQRYAREYVHTWLGRSAHRMTAHPLPDGWTSAGLRPWLADQHDRHGEEFEASAETPMPSREDLVDSTVQLAPLTLIDGGWLQGFCDYGHASGDIGHFLFETYWDELGNGEAKLNHPLIYREVLAEMGVELPDTGSAEFAHWTGFRDGSFALPVFWLAIGRFPRTFLPEILGLNLAMELSGVGGTYRRARLALDTYGFSTRFVDIHNTIDNVATGHSAWAADAVDTFLATAPDSRGAGARDELWRRVRVGYRALNPPDTFSSRLAGRVAARKAAARMAAI